MSATKQPTSGGVDDLRATLRRRHADPPADAPADDQDGPSAAASTDAPAEARADTRAYGITHAPADGPVDAPDGRTMSIGGTETGEAPSGVHGGSQTPRRALEVKARAYKGGLRRLEPRADALAEAVRDVLEAGGTAAEVRGLLAEIGLTTEETPRVVKEALRRR